jgi:hypothetical protein
LLMVLSSRETISGIAEYKGMNTFCFIRD